MNRFPLQDLLPCYADIVRSIQARELIVLGLMPKPETIEDAKKELPMLYELERVYSLLILDHDFPKNNAFRHTLELLHKGVVEEVIAGNGTLEVINRIFDKFWVGLRKCLVFDKEGQRKELLEYIEYISYINSGVSCIPIEIKDAYLCGGTNDIQ